MRKRREDYAPSPWGHGTTAPGGVRYDRSDLESTLAAASQLPTTSYVFATAYGYTIDDLPPPASQRYFKVVPGEGPEMVRPSFDQPGEDILGTAALPQRSIRTVTTVRVAGRDIPLSMPLDPERDEENIRQATDQAERAVRNIGRPVEVVVKSETATEFDTIDWVEGEVVDVARIQLVPFISVHTRKMAIWPVYEVQLKSGEVFEVGILDIRFR